MSLTTSTPSSRRPVPDVDRIDDLVDELTRRLRDGLRRRLAEHARQGHSLDEIGSTEEIASRMLDVLPESSHWNEVLGPFYTTRQVANLLGGASRQALADRRKRGTLLGLKTTDGVLVYPAFQFDEKRRVVSGLSEVLRCFCDVDVDDWTIAGWLVSSLDALEGHSAVGWLRQGGQLEPVLDLARDTARRFAQ